MADTSDLLVQNVVNGKFTTNTAKNTTAEEVETRGTTKLGKDAFLQLLVAEMQNQDPLEPSSNTEWISQLATFSSLEELQTLSSTSENTQILQLTGKHVVVATESASGARVLKSGSVDFVSYQGGEAKFSVNGSLYSLDNLYSVVDDDYFYEQNKPKITTDEKDMSFDFNGNYPEDVVFRVNMGTEEAQAKNVGLIIGNEILPADYITVDGDKVTVSAEILNRLNAGSYTFDIVFDDKNYTTYEKAITINIYNSHPVAEEKVDEKTETDTSTDKNNAADETKETVYIDMSEDDNLDEESGSVKDIHDYSYEELRTLFSNISDEDFENYFGYLFETEDNNE